MSSNFKYINPVFLVSSCFRVSFICCYIIAKSHIKRCGDMEKNPAKKMSATFPECKVVFFVL